MGTISFSTVQDRVELLDKLPATQMRLYAYDCAKYVLPIFEQTNISPIPRTVLEELLSLIKRKKNSDEVEFYNNNLNEVSRVLDTENYVISAIQYAFFSAHSAVPIQYVPSALTMAIFAVYYSEEMSREDSEEYFMHLYEQTLPETPFEPIYITPDTIGLAKEINETKDFRLMPILADALIDLDCPEDQANLVREGKGLSNWALYHLRNTESRGT